MIKAIFFDNDGVLVSSEHLAYEATQEAFNQLRIPYSKTDYEHHTCHTSLGSKGWLKHKGYPDDLHAKFKVIRDPIWNKKLEQEDHLIPEVDTVINKLKTDGFILSLCTSAPNAQFRLQHAQTGLLPLFDFILTQEDTKNLKPDPEIYHQALNLAGVRPEEALVVEDAPRGVAAGVAAGITTVAIPHGMTVGLDISAADYQLESMTELPELIAEINYSSL